MALPYPLRAAALRLPPLARLVAQRDDLVTQRDHLAAERGRLEAALNDEAARHAQLRAEFAALRAETAPLRHAHRFVPPGHFYSPMPDLVAVDRDAARLFPDPPPRTIAGLDLREADQLALLEQSIPLYREMPWAEASQPGLRFDFANGAFSYADAIFLYFTLRRLQPQRVIEVGSGHSSCVTLDTVERFLGDTVETVFIEPYPDLLRSLLRPSDLDRIELVGTRLQDVPLDRFRTLGRNDVLFIDSTHVAKIGSDVTYLFAEILPVLQPGVRVQFHDIFYPFEYPRYWVRDGRAWNEAYLLRGFLQFNARFEIELWNHFLIEFHRPFFEQHMPLCLQNPGASLWLRVV